MIINLQKGHIVTNVKFEDNIVTCSRCGKCWYKDDEGSVHDILYSECSLPDFKKAERLEVSQTPFSVV